MSLTASDYETSKAEFELLLLDNLSLCVFLLYTLIF